MMRATAQYRQPINRYAKPAVKSACAYSLEEAKCFLLRSFTHSSGWRMKSVSRCDSISLISQMVPGIMILVRSIVNIVEGSYRSPAICRHWQVRISYSWLFHGILSAVVGLFLAIAQR